MKSIQSYTSILQPILSFPRQSSIQTSRYQLLYDFHKRFLTTTANNEADFPSFDPMASTIAQRNQRSPRMSFQAPPKPHRLHVYSTRHNCHITLSRGNRDPLISVSSGNIGFRKAQRGTYDAAYQLGTFVVGKINNEGMLSNEYPGKGGPIKELELVLRDFGPGREAVTKILMGVEGKALRNRISRVMDSTRLKFGGTRSPKPRRLG